jgi:hypothetical protein
MTTGKKTGGRRKGTPNRRTAEMRAEIAASGEMPLAYMMRIMRDPTTEPHRAGTLDSAAPTLRALWPISVLHVRSPRPAVADWAGDS